MTLRKLLELWGAAGAPIFFLYLLPPPKAAVSKMGAGGAQRWHQRRRFPGGRGKSRRRRVFREYIIIVDAWGLGNGYHSYRNKSFIQHMRLYKPLKKKMSLRTQFFLHNYVHIFIYFDFNRTLSHSNFVLKSHILHRNYCGEVL